VTAGVPAAAPAGGCECPCVYYAHLGYCTGTAQTTMGVYSAVQDRAYDRKVCTGCRDAIDNVFRHGHPAGLQPEAHTVTTGAPA
jgi:hypothetical protein